MIIGHQRILEYLKKSAQKKKVAHAYLFVGPENVGKRTMAFEFIKMLIGQEIETGVHPDILIIEPSAVEKEAVKVWVSPLEVLSGGEGRSGVVLV